MNKSKKLVFFGNERLATGVTTTAPVLRALIDTGYRVAAVVSSYSEGTSRNARSLEIAEVATTNGIPILLPDRSTDILKQLVDYGAEAGILVAYGKILPQTIIDVFPGGIINIHPSLLPAYRGSTPVETAILDGVRTTGVSLMSLSAQMDAGGVFAQESIDLTASESKQELADRLLGVGRDLLIKNLGAILNGELTPEPQDESKASYTKQLSKADGYIDWTSESAEQIERKVRAFQNFPKTRAQIWDKYEIIITKTRIAASREDGDLVQETSDGYLEILELTVPGGRSISGADFKLGYRP